MSEMSRWYRDGTDDRGLDGGEVGNRRVDRSELRRAWEITKTVLAVVGMVVMIALAIIGLGVVLAVGSVTWPIWTSAL